MTDPYVVGYEVIEFLGKGDPMFGGSADDRPLGKAGEFLRGSYSHSAVAQFATRALAESAAERAVKRPGSRVGVVPIRDYSRAASGPDVGPFPHATLRAALERDEARSSGAPEFQDSLGNKVVTGGEVTRYDSEREAVDYAKSLSEPVSVWHERRAADPKRTTGRLVFKGPTKKIPPGKARCSICGKVGSKANLAKHEAKCKSGDCGDCGHSQGSLFGNPTPAEKDVAKRIADERKKGER